MGLLSVSVAEVLSLLHEISPVGRCIRELEAEVARLWELVECQCGGSRSWKRGWPLHLPDAPTPTVTLGAYPDWDMGTGWRHHLNNLRLLLQPYVCTCLLLPWLHLVSQPHVQAGLAELGSLVNTFLLALPT
jgi:hypothetical protein